MGFIGSLGIEIKYYQNGMRTSSKNKINLNLEVANFLFFRFLQQPNHEDPLNHDAAAVLRDNPKMFESNVRRAMAGGYVGHTFFTRCM